MPMNTMRMTLTAIMAIALLCALPPVEAAGDADDFYEMRRDGERFWSILQGLPYAAEGHGPVMYVFEYSECPYCQRMYADFNRVDLGIEFRRVFVPTSERTAREAAALAKSRSIDDYHAFMTRRKVAPDPRDDAAAVDAVNKVIRAANDELPPILKANGWPLNGIRFPQYAWREGNKVFTNAGYSKPSFSRAVDRAVAASAKPVAASADAFVSRRTPSLEDADVQGVTLGMTPEDIAAVLEPKGWASRRLPQNAYQWTKQEANGSRKTLHVEHRLMPDMPASAKTIRYTQAFDRGTTRLDEAQIADALIGKYGNPSNTARRTQFTPTSERYTQTTMIFEDFEAPLPKLTDVDALCGSKRFTPTSFSTTWETIERFEANCPAPAVRAFRELEAATTAPRLEAQIHLYAFSITMGWTRPDHEVFVAQQAKMRDQAKSRKSVGNVDL